MRDIHQSILDFIREGMTTNGFAPSVREICDHFGWSSPGTAAKYLAEMTRDGLIERVGPRAVKLNA